jgi:hypothetical protein
MAIEDLANLMEFVSVSKDLLDLLVNTKLVQTIATISMKIIKNVRGFCNDGTCLCNKGYSGEACEKLITT